MQKISGKVVVKEWGAGIADLVVSAYAVPVGTAPALTASACERRSLSPSRWSR